MNRDALLAGATLVLALVAIVAAVPSFRHRHGSATWLVRWGDPFAGGVFLGAGLIHLLPDAVTKAAPLGYAIPWSFFICGAVALMLAMLDGSSDRDEGDRDSALVAAAALSVHSFLAGAALGATEARAAMVVLFIALVAHKGAGSFSLSRLLVESSLPPAAAIVVQGFFVLALPVGVVLGAAIVHDRTEASFALPIALAAGAGTFFYFGTMHGSGREAYDRRHLSVKIVGFALMALIAAIG